mmetsp:Transcript_33871/g.101270  ORF Transcript_33871/g.101270 Transcript_33871/m.101270 type:complete len:203 (+) Transcript_33871:483-1091(+)
MAPQPRWSMRAGWQQSAAVGTRTESKWRRWRPRRTSRRAHKSKGRRAHWRTRCSSSTTKRQRQRSRLRRRRSSRRSGSTPMPTQMHAGTPSGRLSSSPTRPNRSTTISTRSSAWKPVVATTPARALAKRRDRDTLRLLMHRRPLPHHPWDPFWSACASWMPLLPAGLEMSSPRSDSNLPVSVKSHAPPSENHRDRASSSGLV